MGPGELAEPYGRKEHPVVLVADPAGIGALEPGVIQQPVHASQPEPVGGP